jgi:hypothetical protein
VNSSFDELGTAFDFRFDRYTMRLPRSILLRHCRTNNIPPQSLQPLQSLSLIPRINSRECLRWNSSSSTNVKLPPQLPTSGAVNLSSLRGLVALHGLDATKFLQGLITKIFPSETEPNGLFTAFLSPQVSPPGRLY